MFNKLHLSFREKSAWITLLVLLFVYLPYFSRVSRFAQRAELSLPTVVGLFIPALILQIALMVIAHIAISVGARDPGRDERDRAIEAKAFRNGYFVFSTAICCAAMWMLTFSTLQKAGEQTAWLSIGGISQVLLLCLVLAEVTKYGTHVICYRRGA